jgi:hypothetical protein
VDENKITPEEAKTMTRNQKIALGCGGAGCLGLIVVTIAGCLIYFFYYNARTRYERATRDYNFNVNLNSNSNSNDDANDNSSNSNSNSNSSSSSSTMSEDDKHKLYHAATVTGDTNLIKRVSIHIGIMKDDGMPAEGYQQFMAQHAAWAFQNLAFIREIGTAEKAQAYIDEHLE